MAICDIPVEEFYLGGDDDEENDRGTEQEDEDDDRDNDLITEVWIEPQDGIIVTASNESKDFGGMHCRDIPRLIYRQDKEVITTLLSLEYLCAMCRDGSLEDTALAPSSPAATSATPGRHRHRGHRKSVVHHGEQGSLLPPPQQAGSICQVPFNFGLMSLLDKVPHTEILVSTFIQDITVDIPIVEGTTAAAIQHFNHAENDASNERLLESFHSEARRLHDREVSFSDADYAAFLEHIRRRNAKSDRSVQIPDTFAKFNDGGNSANTTREHHCSSRMVSGASSNASGATGSVMSKDASSASCQQQARHAPRWRCYTKAVTASDVLITFVSATFQDLKLLLLDDAAMQEKSSRVLDVIAKQATVAERGPQDDAVGDFSNARLKDPATVPPAAETPPCSGTASAASTRARAGSLSSSHAAVAAPRPHSYLRKRTLSIDGPALDAGMERSRCKSMESENLCGLDQQVPNFPPPSDPKSKLRARTHTYSYVHQRSRGGLINKLKTVSDQQQQQQQMDSPGRRKKSATSAPAGVMKKSVHGSLTLPIYSYCCSESELTAVLLKVRKDQRPNATIDITFRPEDKEPEKIHVVEDQQDQSAAKASNQTSSTAASSNNVPPNPMDNLRSLFHEALQKSYFSAFVCTLFQSLQSSLSMHDYDVQQAIDYCDTETILDTDMSTFLRSVCDHAGNGDSESLDCHALKRSKSCVDSNLNHVVMKKKFHDMLLTSFQQVPSVKDLYFFRPSANPVSGAASGLPSQLLNTSASGSNAR